MPQGSLAAQPMATWHASHVEGSGPKGMRVCYPTPATSTATWAAFKTDVDGSLNDSDHITCQLPVSPRGDHLCSAMGPKRSRERDTRAAGTVTDRTPAWLP